MKKILYSNGDSFVLGMECLGDNSRSESNKRLAFPKHIADKLGCETYINNAYNGATNNFIFNNTIFDLIELEKQGYTPADVFVVIGFTSITRIEIDGKEWFGNIPGFDIEYFKDNEEYPAEYADHGVIFANPMSGIRVGFTGSDKVICTEQEIIPLCVKYLWTDPVQVPAQEARVLALHELLKSKGYDHIFVNTCNPLLGTKHTDMTCKNFYYMNYTSFYEFGVDNYPAERRKANHFSPVVHEKYAEKLFDYIKTQGLIS